MKRKQVYGDRNELHPSAYRIRQTTETNHRQASCGKNGKRTISTHGVLDVARF